MTTPPPPTRVETAYVRMALKESNQDPEPQPVATYHPQDQKLPRFDGTTSLEAFLAKFKLFAAHFAWTDHRKSICLAQSLEGPASEVLLDLMSEERLNSTTLMGVLKQRLGDRQSYLALQNQLQLCRRAPGEKLGALAADIARLARQAYLDEPSCVSSRIALDTFLCSLVPPALCPHVSLAGHLTLDEALNYAMAAERVLQDSNPLQPVRVS